jgi:hypothetical protein
LRRAGKAPPFRARSRCAGTDHETARITGGEAQTGTWARTTARQPRAAKPPCRDAATESQKDEGMRRNWLEKRQQVGWGGGGEGRTGEGERVAERGRARRWGGKIERAGLKRQLGRQGKARQGAAPLFCKARLTGA